MSERLQGQGFETYVPGMGVEAGGGGGGFRPYFPCYLFVRFDAERNSLAVLRGTPGLKEVVHFEGQLAVVPDEVVKVLQECLASGVSGEGLNVAGLFAAEAGVVGDKEVLMRSLVAGRAEEGRGRRRKRRRRRTRGRGRRIRYKDSG